MKRSAPLIALLVAAVLGLVSLIAYAAVENDYIIEQIGTDGFSKIPRVLAQPAGNADGIYCYNGSTKISYFCTIGSGLAVSSGALTATSTPPSINDAPGRTLVTSTSATGFQISATRNAQVCYEGAFSTTSTIGGPSAASVFLETADTNSTTPSDWTIKASQTYSNTITLAIVLNQVQGNNWMMCRTIQAGKFIRIRSGSISGTASVSLNSTQQEVQI